MFRRRFFMPQAPQHTCTRPYKYNLIVYARLCFQKTILSFHQILCSKLINIVFFSYLHKQKAHFISMQNSLCVFQLMSLKFDENNRTRARLLFVDIPRKLFSTFAVLSFLNRSIEFFHTFFNALFNLNIHFVSF